VLFTWFFSIGAWDKSPATVFAPPVSTHMIIKTVRMTVGFAAVLCLLWLCSLFLVFTYYKKVQGQGILYLLVYAKFDNYSMKDKEIS